MRSAVLFDLDDTLVDEASAAREAVLAWATALGVADREVAQRWAGISAAHYARYQRRELTFREQRRQRVRDFLAAAVTDSEADRLFADYLRRYESGWIVFDDAVPTIRRARAAGLAVAVLTNGEESQQRRKLDRLSLGTEIDLLVASSSLPAGKPDRRAFQAAVGRLGLATTDALMVGDSVQNDVRGALAAGLGAVLLDRPDAHPGVDLPRIRSLHDLSFTNRD